MDRCPKDEPAAKNLVCKKNSSHSQEKLENLHPPPSLAIGGLISNIWIFRMNNSSYSQIFISSTLIIRPGLAFVGSKATSDLIKAQGSDLLIFFKHDQVWQNLNFTMRWPCSSMLSYWLACARFISCSRQKILE